MKQKRLLYTEPTTDRDILAAFSGQDEWLTRAQICERCYRAKTPSMRARITRLVAEGYLQIELYKMPNGVDAYIYRRILPLDEIPI